jgi:hypothetical protein
MIETEKQNGRLTEKPANGAKLSSISLELLEDIRNFLSKEIDLLWLEVREKLSQSTSLLILLMALATLAIVAGQLLVLGLVFYLAKAWQLELHQSFALTGATALALCAVAGCVAWFGFRNLFTKPLETPGLMKEHWQWILQKKN